MNKMIPKILGLILVISMTGCGPGVGTSVEDETQLKITQTTPSAGPATLTPDKTILGTTQNNLFGNHVVDGRIDLTSASILDIPIDGVPLWLASVPANNYALFVAVMDNGATKAFKISENTFEPHNLSPAQLPKGAPPLLAISDSNIQIILPPEDASPFTNPMLINNKLAYIATNGDIVMETSTLQTRLPIDALTDARILIDENQRLLILTQPTKRYDHGVLGDDLEASGITLLETQPELRIIQKILIETPDVIEGISPIWADINHDGVREIIVTLSNDQSGARIAAFLENGTLLAESPGLQTGYRWRHQIAIAEFGATSQPVLVSVRTPHIGGVVEFFQLKDGKLEIIGEVAGFSSHSIGSRNLDSAIAGDFNNDGVKELLVPDQIHSNLGVIAINGVLAMLPIGGVLTSNLSATTVDGKVIIGAGTQGNIRIWIQ